jgi:cobalamin biosynthetic protein CobC
MADEAFIDAAPESSVAAFSARPGLIVLRSLGKFFGLAGARVGFMLAAAPLRQSMAEQLGPWTVAGPSRAIAGQALLDRDWQQAARPRLQQAGAALAALLRRNGLPPSGGCALFQWVRTPQARDIHEALAQRGILSRLFDEPDGLRFGLPAAAADWLRLEDALRALALAEAAA